MKQKDIIVLLAVAAGGYLGYWFLTHKGPNGDVFNAAGVPVNQSWWDHWFGGALSTTTSTTPVQSLQSQPVQQITAPGSQTSTPIPPASSTPTSPTPPIPPVVRRTDPLALSSQRQQLAAQLIAAANAGSNAMFNADGWSYYYAHVTGAALTPQQFGSFFPNLTQNDRGPAMSVTDFVNAIAPGLGLSGLGDIVRVSSAPSAMSMAFSNGGRRSAFRGKGGLYLQ